MTSKASQKDATDSMQPRINALMTEWADFKEHGQRIEDMVLALAEAHGLPSVLPDSAG
jgi:hypothetical protein